MSRSWSELSPRTRRLILAGAAFDTAMKVLALRDLRRSPEEIRGSKKKWALALAFVNSACVLPVVYFRRGRISRQRTAAASRHARPTPPLRA